ncbi:LPXTG cell wall anchor domain-containing protein [Clostridium perfringens]|uniref:LPXTG cell wall anchor domain-containing protein n=1 Tax=Clostridium perfringens TaxID=1502 RepID=UPI0039E8291E
MYASDFAKNKNIDEHINIQEENFTKMTDTKSDTEQSESSSIQKESDKVDEQLNLDKVNNENSLDDEDISIVENPDQNSESTNNVDKYTEKNSDQNNEADINKIDNNVESQNTQQKVGQLNVENLDQNNKVDVNKADNSVESQNDKQKLGKLNFYSYGSADNFVKEDVCNKPYYSIPFTKDGDKLKSINLEDERENILEAFKKGSDSYFDLNIKFKDNNGNYITSFNPNDLENKSIDVPIYIVPEYISEDDNWINEDVEELDKIQNTLNGLEINTNDIFDKTIPFDTQLMGIWGIRTPLENIKNGEYCNGAGPYEPSGIEAYTITQFNSLFDSQYFKINVESENPDYPSGTYYLDMSNSMGYLDGLVKLYNYMEKSDFIHLNKDEYFYDVLNNITGNYYDVINQEEYNKLYQEKLNDFNDNNGKLTFYPSAYEGNIALLPKYDNKGEAIAKQYIGRVCFSNIYNENERLLRIVYLPIDKTYTGIIDPLYWISAGGSNGSGAGFLTLPMKAFEESVEPEKPVTPVDPQEPTTPTTPTTPVDPQEPIKPVDPQEPTKPITPVDPQEPTKPVTPVDPQEPIKPVTPVDPQEPIKPVTPVDSQEPIKPVTPVDSQEPIKPQEPISKDGINNKLPKTGYENNILIVLGVLLSLIGIGVIRFNKRCHEK